MTLPEYIASNRRRPFEWGSFDCVLFVAGWVRLRTGVDQLAGLPAWTSEREARRVIASIGGLSAALDSRLVRIKPGMAIDGDIGIVENTLGVFTGRHIVAAGQSGLIFIDRMRAECAWAC